MGPQWNIWSKPQGFARKYRYVHGGHRGQGPYGICRPKPQGTGPNEPLRPGRTLLEHSTLNLWDFGLHVPVGHEMTITNIKNIHRSSTRSP